MTKKSQGINAAKKLQKRRRKSNWQDKTWVRRVLKSKEKTDPLKGAPMAKGIILQLVEVEAKQPNSAKRKCARVQLTKNGKQITAFLPGDGASKLVSEHDEVIVECIGGKMGRAKGDIPGVRYKIIQVNDQPLHRLAKGKIEKGRR